MEPKPRNLPLVLLISSAILMLLENILGVFFVGAGEPSGVATLEATKQAVLSKWEVLEWIAIIYLLACLGLYVFWIKRKPWVKWAILVLVGIHLSEFISFFVVIIGIQNILGIIELMVYSVVGLLWFLPPALDVAVLFLVFSNKNQARQG